MSTQTCLSKASGSVSMRRRLGTTRSAALFLLITGSITCSAPPDDEEPIGQTREPLACDPMNTREKWNDWFCINNEDCAVGDANNDTAADIITFVKNPPVVYVALSNAGGLGGPTGTKSFGSGLPWSDNFCVTGQTCAVGNIDGTNGTDLVAFVRNTQSGVGLNDVYVARSNGSSGFLGAQKWHDSFCALGQDCFVADVNADQKDDLIAFVRTRRPAVAQVMCGWRSPREQRSVLLRTGSVGRTTTV